MTQEPYAESGEGEYAYKRREFLRSPATKTLNSARGSSPGGLRAWIARTGTKGVSFVRWGFFWAWFFLVVVGALAALHVGDMSVKPTSLGPPVKFSSHMEQILMVGAPGLKKVLAYLGGGQMAGNPKAETVYNKIMQQVKMLSEEDVRVQLPVFTDDLLSEALVARLQEHCDARTAAWKEVYDHAVALWKSEEDAARAGLAKLSARAEMLSPLAEGEAAIAAVRQAEREAFYESQELEQRGRGVAAAPVPREPPRVAISGKGGKGVAGGAGGTGVSLSDGRFDEQALTASVTKSVMGAVKDAMAGMVQSVEQLSMRVQQQAAVTSGQLERVLQLVGEPPEDCEARDRHMIGELLAALQVSFNSAGALFQEHGEDMRVAAVMKGANMMLAAYVFRVLAAQRGFDAVKGFDQAVFSEATEDRRRSMIEQVKSKVAKKRGGARGPWHTTGGVAVGPTGQVWPMQQSVGAGYNHEFGAAPVLPSWAGVPQGWGPVQGTVAGVPGAAGPSVAQGPVVAGALAPQGMMNMAPMPVLRPGGGFAVSSGVCRRCGQPGHYVANCPVPLKCWTCGLDGYTKNTCPQCRGRVASPGQ